MCESKVHACVKPSRSAFCVNSTTRQAGGSVWKVTPKFMLFSLVLSGTRDGGRGGGHEPGGKGVGGDDYSHPDPERREVVRRPGPLLGISRCKVVVVQGRGADLILYRAEPRRVTHRHVPEPFLRQLGSFSRRLVSFLFRWRLLRVCPP